MELLEQYFDTAFDSPNGIKELRSLILKLAMLGKLVPQNKNDQPASELLKEIQAEKEKLIAEGQIKKQKTLPEIKVEEVPYELPKGWVWTRLGSMSEIIGGFAYKSNEFVDDSNYQVIRLGNIRPDFLRLLENPVYISQYYAEKTSDYRIKCDDILITMTGTRAKKDYLYSTKISADDLTEKDLYLNQRVGLIRAYRDPSFVNLVIKLENFKESIYKTSTGSANQANISMVALRNWILPLPPLNEQKRIVAKINELMARCDEMERLKKEQQEKQLKTNTAALHQLMESSDSGSFSSAFTFITNNFSTLYGVKENVESLKKSILRLAMMGKLVPQDKNDQPASELLKEIQAEKEKLISEGKIKKQKALPEIKAEEVPYELPEGWVWTRLGEIANFIDYRGKTPTKINDGIPLITAKNIRFGYIDRNPYEYISEEEYNERMTRGFPKVGDLLFTTEAPLGNVAQINIEERFALAQRAICFQFYNPEISNYLLKYIMSLEFQELLINNATGMTAKGIKSATLKTLLTKLPPLSEQKRIVAKINELMLLCDNMIEKIDLSEQTQEKLLQSVLSKV